MANGGEALIRSRDAEAGLGLRGTDHHKKMRFQISELNCNRESAQCAASHVSYLDTQEQRTLLGCDERPRSTDTENKSEGQECSVRAAATHCEIVGRCTAAAAAFFANAPFFRGSRS